MSPSSTREVTSYSAGEPFDLKGHKGVLYSKHRIGRCPPSSGTFLAETEIQSLTLGFPHLPPTCRDSMEESATGKSISQISSALPPLWIDFL